MIRGKRIRTNLKSQLLLEAQRLHQLLMRRNLRLVLAESCTGGMVAATLSGIPGISENFCGSAVTYRNATKTKWLGVSAKHLKEMGAVNRETAIQMARGALERTPEADLAASITGHLGPYVPKTLEGVIFMAVALRSPTRKGKPSVFVHEHQLLTRPFHLPQIAPAQRIRASHRILRLQRQVSASHSLILMVRSLLEYA